MGIFLFRIFFVAVTAAAGYFVPPFGLDRIPAAAVAGFLAAATLFLESRVRRASFTVIWGSVVGTLVGVILGWILGAAYQSMTSDPGTAAFVRVMFLLLLPAAGFLIGIRKSEWLDPSYLFRFFREKNNGRIFKILDTSVIIDGRIAEICEAGFLEGTLVVPQFVLKELQMVADSPDGLKRQRGRRGLDILDHLQKSKTANVMITEMDFPEIREVDTKLIEVACRLEGKIVTNDVNLNKVARLRGVAVLNINEMANAIKPVVLPGESMMVYLIKEGKEKDQGVAYLDDGTMVVVDNARRMIGRNVDIMVTSVLQTTVGKMIFGRYNDEAK
ncbi:MAG: PIN domain-containing protein [Acidobacteriota bacterium]|jgi:Integral membrane protein (PIN domain superfamily)|nr:PIN domain nuclease [Acidobacteriota bacterium]OQB57444.1 MAG: putative PIN and TRAM-domain containing protein precursor [Candidatus Aminicenantes bacterium ADurb.Bin147]HNQ80076.1 PIN domain-containing protein [Candidatus Aminicenantes bacterium]MDD8032608.1 PIN domain-containing protein [Acidobacteriota bacterium]MDD8038788.1 PIN domain-containing protein [Acidobacteriota bacterium]